MGENEIPERPTSSLLAAVRRSGMSQCQEWSAACFDYSEPEQAPLDWPSVRRATTRRRRGSSLRVALLVFLLIAIVGFVALEWGFPGLSNGLALPI